MKSERMLKYCRCLDLPATAAAKLLAIAAVWNSHTAAAGWTVRKSEGKSCAALRPEGLVVPRTVSVPALAIYNGQTG